MRRFLRRILVFGITDLLIAADVRCGAPGFGALLPTGR
jgi:hypothetical protein